MNILRKNDIIRQSDTGAMHVAIQTKNGIAELSNGHKAYAFPAENENGIAIYKRHSDYLPAEYTFHLRPNPAKVKKQNFGLFGKPLVVDLDKEGVL